MSLEHSNFVFEMRNHRFLFFYDFPKICNAVLCGKSFFKTCELLSIQPRKLSLFYGRVILTLLLLLIDANFYQNNSNRLQLYLIQQVLSIYNIPKKLFCCIYATLARAVFLHVPNGTPTTTAMLNASTNIVLTSTSAICTANGVTWIIPCYGK